MLQTMMDFFEEIDWAYDQLPDPPDTLMLYHEEPNVGGWTCYALARELQQQCLFYSECPIQIPEELWPAVSDFLMRANYGMPIGNFEMNLENGQIRFKTGIDIEGDRLSVPLFKAMVKANLTMMAQYLPGIVLVGLEERSPQVAIESIKS
ncbi:MAG: YbjN domain-containing protein [Cyanobacteria bacterium J06592_8]